MEEWKQRACQRAIAIHREEIAWCADELAQGVTPLRALALLQRMEIHLGHIQAVKRQMRPGFWQRLKEVF